MSSVIKIIDPETAKKNNALFDSLWDKQNPPRATRPEKLYCMWYFVPEHWKRSVRRYSHVRNKNKEG